MGKELKTVADIERYLEECIREYNHADGTGGIMKYCHDSNPKRILRTVADKAFAIDVYIYDDSINERGNEDLHEEKNHKVGIDYQVPLIMLRPHGGNGSYIWQSCPVDQSCSDAIYEDLPIDLAQVVKFLVTPFKEKNV